MFKKIIPAFWIIGAVALFLYSFTQVDLSLAFSSNPFVQSILKNFQYIGWFDRSLSALLFILLIIYLFALYLLTLKISPSRRTVWVIILSVSIVLTFSYNAFSYDLFNYIFDARIITHYGQNPYLHKALDFPNDPMLSFMRWTHRVYPYGPVWLLVTVPLTFIGSGLFLLTFFLFKFLSLGSFLLTAFFIEKIMTVFSKKYSIHALMFFALNPLIFIEFLVSAHNDNVMLCLAIVSIYFLLRRKKVISFAMLLLSIGVKFATVFLVPAFTFFIFKEKNEKNLSVFFHLLVFFMIPAVLLASFRTNFQPWYLLNILVFSSFLVYKKYVFVPSILISFLGLINYLPFLYFGVYDHTTSQLMQLVNILMLLTGFASLIFLFSIENRKKSS